MTRFRSIQVGICMRYGHAHTFLVWALASAAWEELFSWLQSLRLLRCGWLLLGVTMVTALVRWLFYNGMRCPWWLDAMYHESRFVDTYPHVVANRR